MPHIMLACVYGYNIGKPPRLERAIAFYPQVARLGHHLSMYLQGGRPFGEWSSAKYHV